MSGNDDLDNLREFIVQVRLSKVEKSRIDSFCKRSGRPVGTFLRNCALDKINLYLARGDDFGKSDNDL